jgi:hypothetical protein
VLATAVRQILQVYPALEVVLTERRNLYMLELMGTSTPDKDGREALFQRATAVEELLIWIKNHAG